MHGKCSILLRERSPDHITQFKHGYLTSEAVEVHVL